ncbi:MAG: Flp pilus assembly complex ATPase component TadA, partial [Verrucomicrobia bacterium]|nr:Flp pilus assembly complex ATPase component TadA [Verrucomicrobiota bacterium]
MSKIEHVDAWKTIAAFVRQYNCSDLTFNRLNVSGRVDNAIVRLSEDNVFTREAFEELLHSMLDSRPDLKSNLANGMPSLDFSVVKGGMRFRVNIVRSQGELTASLRPLPENPPSLKDIGIKEIVARTVLGYQSGLFVVAGPTGSGKTTT